jgi:hypothetical protein
MAKNDSQAKPIEFVQKMYMQINNIAQGFAIAILIETLSERFMNGPRSFVADDFYILNLAFTSLFISIIFWTRYYFDTEVIKRAFSVRSVTWFFLYIIAEGFSFKQISEPTNWLYSTGIFLFFGFGFYILNLAEIPKASTKKITTKLKTKENLFRKVLNRGKAIYLYLFKEKKNYRDWQKERLVDIVILFILTFVGGWLVMYEPLVIYPISVVTLLFAGWQLSKSRDYKRFGF